MPGKLYISPNPNLQIVGLRREIAERHPATGEIIGVTQPGISVEFLHGAVPGWAVELGLANEKFHARWSGLPDEAERRTYLSGYDTGWEQERHGWSDETRLYVEEKLEKHPLYGQNFILAERKRPTPPIANYDDLHHNKIPVLARDSGLAAEFLDYERATKNRPGVVAALEEELAKASEGLVAA